MTAQEDKDLARLRGPGLLICDRVEEVAEERYHLAPASDGALQLASATQLSQAGPSPCPTPILFLPGVLNEAELHRCSSHSRPKPGKPCVPAGWLMHGGGHCSQSHENTEPVRLKFGGCCLRSQYGKATS